MTWQAAWLVLFGLPGCFFITVGTLGLIRLPDLRSRIHALAKADTLGLGLIALALLPQAGSPGAAAKMVLVWLLALGSATVIAHVLARDVPAEDAR